MRLKCFAPALLGLMLLAGCASTGGKMPRYAANWDNLRIGMSKSTVRHLLGQPTWRSEVSDVAPHTPMGEFGDDRSKLKADVEAIFTSPEMWQYSRINLLEPPGLYEPEDDAFVVYFDRQGYVTRYRRALKGPFATTTQPSPSSPPASP